MITFNQYCEKYWESKPKVLFGINDNHFYEEFKDIDDYMFHIGENPKTFAPWSYIGSGIHEIKQPIDDNEYEHVDGTKFKNLESAQLYGNNKKRRYLKNLEQEHKDLSRLYNYTGQQEFHLNNYTHGSKSLNEALLHNKQLNMSQHSMVKHLEDIFREMKTPKDLIVYTGTNQFHANKIRAHEIVEHPSYISASICPAKAASFAKSNGGDIIKIHLPKNYPSAYVGHISQHPGEREIILPKGLNLKIHNDKKMYHHDSMGNTVVHHTTIENE